MGNKWKVIVTNQNNRIGKMLFWCLSEDQDGILKKQIRIISTHLWRAFFAIVVLCAKSFLSWNFCEIWILFKPENVSHSLHCFLTSWNIDWPLFWAGRSSKSVKGRPTRYFQMKKYQTLVHNRCTRYNLYNTFKKLYNTFTKLLQYSYNEVYNNNISKYLKVSFNSSTL